MLRNHENGKNNYGKKVYLDFNIDYSIESVHKTHKIDISK